MKKVAISGELNFETVMQKRIPFLAAIETSPNTSVTLDMSEVSLANSAGLAMMLEGIRLAKRYDVELRFQAVPESLIHQARFCNLLNVLKLTPKENNKND